MVLYLNGFTTLRIEQIAVSIDPRGGGEERFVVDLIKELIKMGHKVTLITCDKKINVDIDCHVHYIRGWKPSGFPVIPSLKDLIKSLHSESDIVHLHYYPLFGEVVALACKLCGKTLITTMHSEMKRDVYKTIYDRVQLCIISSLSDEVICLTDGMKRALVRRGLDERKAIVIPNAIHVKELQSQASNLKDDVHLDSDFDLLFVGRLEERKGAQYLLKALSLLKKENFKPMLKIVGKGIYKHKLISLVREYGLSSQVIFTGYSSQEELLRSYLNVRCVVIPSLYEGTPNRVVIEALALGKPIITTSIPGNEAISSNELGFIVPPKDCKALARAVRKALLLTDDKLNKIELKTKKFAEQYDWSCVINQIISLYNDFN